METKTRKTTMIGAALAVAIIALAGAGYAAVTQYTATTTNTDNYMAATYLELTQDGTGKYTSNFLDDIYFESKNVADSSSTTGNKTTYTPVYTHDATYNEVPSSDTTTVKKFALISNDLKLMLDPTNPKADTVGMEVRVTNNTFDAQDGLVYTMVLGKYTTDTTNNTTTFAAITNGVTTYDTTKGAWIFGSLPLDKTTDATPVVKDTTWSVLLFVSLNNGAQYANGVDDADTGFPSASETKAIFEFKVIAPAA